MCPLSGAYPLAGTQQARTEEVENSCLNARVSTVGALSDLSVPKR